MQAKNEVFFVFTLATSCLFSVLSLFSAEEAAMLMLETGGLCFRKIQDWQSAPDGELVCCFFCGCRLCGHIPATLHLCDVIKRATPHAIWSFFSIKNMSNSVLPLWAFIKIVLLIEKPCIFTYMYFYVCLFPVSKVWCFSWLSVPVLLCRRLPPGGAR